MLRERGKQVRVIITGLALAGLVGCGGRTANLIEVSNAYDADLSCTHLSGEYDNNNKRLVELVGERSDKVANNIGTVLFISPLFIDLSQAQKREATALAERNERLSSLGAAKSCAFAMAEPTS